MGVTIGNVESVKEFSLDAVSGETWIEPVFIAPLKAKMEVDREPIPYSESYVGKMLRGYYSRGKSYSPIEHIQGRGDIETTAQHLADVMLKNFSSLPVDDRRDLRQYLLYLFTELMNNVADHAYSTVGGFAMAQFYPTQKRIQFVIADAGIGFLSNIRQKDERVDSECEAIKRALEKGFTASRERTYGGERNAGFGLYAMKEILDAVGGTFVIASNGALLRYRDKEFSCHTLEAPYSGSFVAFDFYENAINLELSQILGGIRETDIDEEEDLY
jgi:anti-sigma regulatory factor (Ser/Thr protein kinase)